MAQLSTKSIKKGKETKKEFEGGAGKLPKEVDQKSKIKEIK